MKLIGTPACTAPSSRATRRANSLSQRWADPIATSLSRRRHRPQRHRLSADVSVDVGINVELCPPTLDRWTATPSTGTSPQGLPPERMPVSLFRCPECDGLVSSHAAACPHCGFPVQQRKSRSPNLVAPSRSENATYSKRHKDVRGNRRFPGSADQGRCDICEAPDGSHLEWCEDIRPLSPERLRAFFSPSPGEGAAGDSASDWGAGGRVPSIRSGPGSRDYLDFNHVARRGSWPSFAVPLIIIASLAAAILAIVGIGKLNEFNEFNAEHGQNGSAYIPSEWCISACHACEDFVYYAGYAGAERICPVGDQCMNQCSQTDWEHNITRAPEPIRVLGAGVSIRTSASFYGAARESSP